MYATSIAVKEEFSITAYLANIWKRFLNYTPAYIGAAMLEESRVISHMMMRQP